MKADLLTDVLTEVGEHFGSTSQPRVRRLDSRQGRCSEVSRLEILLDEDVYTVYVKRDTVRNKPEDPIKSRINVEYDILSKLHRQFESVPDLAVIKPIAILSEHQVIVTVEAPGQSLMEQIGQSTKIYQWRDRQELLEHYCWLSGKWLSKFHCITFKEKGNINIDNLIEYCDFRLKYLVRDGESSIDQSFREKIVDYLLNQHECVRKNSDRISGCHNDFSPHNIIAHNRTINVLDFSFFCYDCFVYDVYRFWHHLECMKSSPTFNSGRISRLQGRFLSGYGLDFDFDDPLTKLAACRFNLTRIYTMSGQKRRSVGRRWIDRRLIQACYGWLAREIGVE